MPRVLVVEDDQALTELLRYNLEHAGYDVETIGHGDAAQRRLSDDLPELLLLDWVLPGTSGLEICRRLRKRALARRLQIIMLTARNDDVDRMLAIDTGADDFVVKPFSVTDLMSRIAALMDRHRADAQVC
jgi:two-component system, OmpR family, phosphate regulon response regulator PhoB